MSEQTSGSDEMLPLIAEPEELKILLITRELTEHLWLRYLLEHAESFNSQLTWCYDLGELHELLNLESFDVLLWDCNCRDEDPLIFLGFLAIESDQTPVICLSAESERLMSKPIFQAGGADYLCKSLLSDALLERSVRNVVLRHSVTPQQDTRSHIDTLPSISTFLDAKREQGSSYHYYHQKMSVAVERELDAEFRTALRDDQLRLYYQPRINIGNDQVVGYECLIRWEHPTRGLIMPDQFIPAAERSGMIVPMGYWVVEQACRDLALLQELGYDDLVCAVNLSFRQFYDKKLSETVFRIIYNANINTGNLEFELTESAMMYDQEYTRHCLEQLAQLGVSFSLDDFGTGYSSFANIQQLPISTIKIDKSFIDNVCTNVDDEVIVKAIISLAHNLQINVVAEGVEDKAQLDFLLTNHCDEVQGFYYSNAVKLESFLTYLENSYAQLSAVTRITG